METMVASVVLVIVFVLSSIILNSIFKKAIVSRSMHVRSHLEFLSYQLLHDQLQVPHSERYNGWDITIKPYQSSGSSAVKLVAKKAELNHSIIHYDDTTF
jgi:methenyltetrahydromethanopterin cyclohydrolase